MRETRGPGGPVSQNITELLRKGIGDDRYNEMIKDETNGQPKNCEGLVTVKTNQLVWDAVTPSAHTNDLKFQKIETSIVKAATISQGSKWNCSHLRWA